MKRKSDLDLEFVARPKPKSRYLAVRSLGRLMTLIALSGLFLAAYAGRSQLRPAGPRVRRLIPVPATPGKLQQLPAPPALDPSIIVAPSGIDDAMILTADADIDEAMIVTPGRVRGRVWWTTPGLPPADAAPAPPGSWPKPPLAPSP